LCVYEVPYLPKDEKSILVVVVVVAEVAIGRM